VVVDDTSQANISNRNTNKAINTEIMNPHHFIVHAGYDMAIMKKVHSHSKGLLLMAENHMTSRRIMLVEDNEDINHLFWIVLQDADSRLNVDAFTDPFVALENFRPGLYDLLLIDVTMPKLDGFELYSRIRSLDDRVKVCFLTAGEMYYKEIRQEAFPELDVNCFIGKPIANQDLVKRVKEVLELK
jgi:CheY-like chemotaxis protein